MRFATIGAVASALIVSGCAEQSSIFHDRAIKPDSMPHVITVDAKQRSVLFNPVTDPASQTSSQTTSNGFAPGLGSDGKPAMVPSQTITSSNTSTSAAKNWRLCAEASPDVFSALATSASGEASTDGKTSFGAKFGLSSAETAATIGRTQAINMLRESMYRTCERYLSGAISKTIFVTQAARDQRSMIAFLAIEQLTGTVKPPATIISGPGTSAALGAGAEAVKLVADFRKSAIDAASAEAAATAAFNTAKGKANCDTELAADADQTTQDNYKACLDAKAEQAAKKAANEKAQTQLDQALKLGATAGALAEAGTQAGQTNAGAGTADSEVSQHIANAVTTIVTASNINEALMFCIGYFNDPQAFARGELTDVCKTIIHDSGATDDKALNKLYGSDSNFVAGVKLSDSYESFKAGLLAAIWKEAEIDIQKKMAAFEKSAAVMQMTSCKSRAKCSEAVANNRFRGDYQFNPEGMAKALADWDQN